MFSLFYLRLVTYQFSLQQSELLPVRLLHVAHDFRDTIVLMSQTLSGPLAQSPCSITLRDVIMWATKSYVVCVAAERSFGALLTMRSESLYKHGSGDISSIHKRSALEEETVRFEPRRMLWYSFHISLHYHVLVVTLC